MIKKEIHSFFEDKQKLTISEIKKYPNSGWNSQDFLVKEMEISPFRAMVYAECIQKTNESLKENIDKTYFTNMWENNHNVITEEFKKLLLDCGPMVAAKFFADMMENMSVHLRNTLMNTNR